MIHPVRAIGQAIYRVHRTLADDHEFGYGFLGALAGIGAIAGGTAYLDHLDDQGTREAEAAAYAAQVQQDQAAASDDAAIQGLADQGFMAVQQFSPRAMELVNESGRFPVVSATAGSTVQLGNGAQLIDISLDPTKAPREPQCVQVETETALINREIAAGSNAPGASAGPTAASEDVIGMFSRTPNPQGPDAVLCVVRKNGNGTPNLQFAVAAQDQFLDGRSLSQ